MIPNLTEAMNKKKPIPPTPREKYPMSQASVSQPSNTKPNKQYHNSEPTKSLEFKPSRALRGHIQSKNPAEDVNNIFEMKDRGNLPNQSLNQHDDPGKNIANKVTEIFSKKPVKVNLPAPKMKEIIREEPTDVQSLNIAKSLKNAPYDARSHHIIQSTLSMLDLDGTQEKISSNNSNATKFDSNGSMGAIINTTSV